jgi:hypothetical protein
MLVLLMLLQAAMPIPGAQLDTQPPPEKEQGNDYRSKVNFKFDLQYIGQDALASDQLPLALQRPPTGPDAQAAGLAAHVDYLASEHVLGTEGLGWSHLRTYYNGYLLQRLGLTDQDPRTQAALFPTAYLGRDNATGGYNSTGYDVRSGYAEINGFSDEGPGSKVWVRAGRQFRYGAGIATFDGGTIGYSTGAFEVTGWGGRRSPRFLDDFDPGVVGGVDFTLHLAPLADIPVDLSFDYLGYGVGDTSTHLMTFNGRWQMRHGGKLVYSLNLVNADQTRVAEAGRATGVRLYAAFTEPLSSFAQFKVSYDLKTGQDLVYDFVSGFGLSPSRFFTLPDTEPRSRIGLRFDHQIGGFEYALLAQFNLVHGSGNIDNTQGWVGPTAFDATYEEVGAIVRMLPVIAGPVTPELEYRARFVQRTDEDGGFFSTSQAGEHQFQELRADVRIRSGKTVQILTGMVYRVYDFVTRYAPADQSTTVHNDTTVAYELQLDWQIVKGWTLRGRYEIGEDSQAFAPELGIVQSGSLAVGGRF